MVNRQNGQIGQAMSQDDEKPLEINPLDRIGPEEKPHYARLDLTDMQAAFVSAFLANGGNATRAADAVGYKSPRVAGNALTRNPKVASAIRRAIRSEITTKGTKLAWSAIERILEDPTAPYSVQLKAATKVLDYTFGKDGNKSDPDNPISDKPIAEMTVEELQGVIDKGTAMLKTVANAVDVTPEYVDNSDT